jgi:hypothetical protein
MAATLSELGLQPPIVDVQHLDFVPKGFDNMIIKFHKREEITRWRARIGRPVIVSILASWKYGHQWTESMINDGYEPCRAADARRLPSLSMSMTIGSETWGASMPMKACAM